MDYVYIGKFVNTHGIKGEIRLLSNFELKDKVFIPGFSVYFGDAKKEFKITGYRKHKNFDMITLDGISDINDVLPYKGQKVYVRRDDLELDSDDYILDDLIGMDIICDDKSFGVVKNIYQQKNNILLAIAYSKNYYIPYQKQFIKSVDVKKKIIYTIDVKELIL